MALPSKSRIGDGTSVAANTWFTVIPAVASGVTLAVHGLIATNSLGSGGSQIKVQLRMTKSNGDVFHFTVDGPIQVGGAVEVMESTHNFEAGDKLEAKSDTANSLTLLASYAERS